MNIDDDSDAIIGGVVGGLCGVLMLFLYVKTKGGASASGDGSSWSFNLPGDLSGGGGYEYMLCTIHIALRPDSGAPRRWVMLYDTIYVCTTQMPPGAYPRLRHVVTKNIYPFQTLVTSSHYYRDTRHRTRSCLLLSPRF